MRLDSLRYHFARLRREMGQKLPLGTRGYRIRGYLPNRLTTSSSHEPHLVAPLRRAMDARPGVVIDIGVNTGQTLLKILSIDPGRAYIGFEPQVGCCFFVDQFLRDNRIDNAQVVCLAVSDENKVVPIFARGQVDEMASLIDGSTRRRQDKLTRYVPARIGDEVLAEMAVNDPAILKIDVEGAELHVLRGFALTIARSRPICFFEVLANFVGVERTLVDPAVAASNRKAAAEMMRFFEDANYEIRQIDDSGGENPISAFDLDTPSAYVGRDYVAYPRTS